MKNIKLILLTIIITVLGVSCEDDGGTSIIALDDGAVPNMAKADGSEAIIDLVRLNNGENITLTFSADIAQGNPASTDIVGVLTTLAGPVYNSTLFSNVSLPQDFTIATDDIVAAFTELTSPSDISLGDVLTITTRFTMPDGTVLDIVNSDGSSGTGTNIQTTVLFTTVINYQVSCPSDIGGTYLVSSTGTGCCGVEDPITDYQYTVTVTDNRGGSYALSDYSGGAYDGLFCVPFGICGDASGGDITDVCGTLSGSSPDCCGDLITFTGVINEDDTWSVEISSEFVLVKSVWTKQ